MAKADLHHPVGGIHGGFAKDGIVNRQKKYRDAKGRVFAVGVQEEYRIMNPRNFKKKPAKGAELAHQNLWKETCNRAKPIIQHPESELCQTYLRRFEAQLPGLRGKHADPQAPIDPATNLPKRYVQFASFVRAMIYKDLKSAEFPTPETP